MIKHLYPQQQASLSQLSATEVLCSGFQHGATTYSGYILSFHASFSASSKYLFLFLSRGIWHKKHNIICYAVGGETPSFTFVTIRWLYIYIYTTIV